MPLAKHERPKLQRRIHPRNRAVELEEVHQQKERLHNMEARFMTLTQAPPASVINQDMGDREEEIAAHCLSKRVTVRNGLSTVAKNGSSITVYSSPIRVNNLNKQTQISSPAKHYATSVCPLPLGTTPQHSPLSLVLVVGQRRP